jgi:hypothetical protein
VINIYYLVGYIPLLFIKMRIYKSISDPVVEILDYDERINGPDRGLINAWFVGRNRAQRDCDLVARIMAGELPVLAVKGGVEKKVRVDKVGSLWYLATWQGLRGDDLDIDTESEYSMVCSRFGVRVVYTFDLAKLGRSQGDD